MNTSKTIVVLHPLSAQRLLLRSVLQDHGRTVITDLSWSELLSDRSGLIPAVVLLDRSFADVLPRFQQKWPDSEMLLLPQGLDQTETWRDSILQLLRHLDDLSSTKSTPRFQAASERTT